MKLKVGDKVEIVRYGAPFWSWHEMPAFKLLSEDKSPYWYDLMPELVGQKGVITKITITQGSKNYALSGVNKTAWYNEDQLKKL